MGFLDAILGRTKPPQADIDVLFRLPQAAVTLEAEGFTFTGTGSVCYRDSEGSADNTVLDEVAQMVGTDARATVDSTTDSYGFTWFTVTRPQTGVAGITDVATDLHAANSSLVDHGFGSALLCSTFNFRHDDAVLALVYLFKRGTFYPFVPAGEPRRDNALELRVNGIVGADLPVEKDLSRWLAIWGAPGL